jgi:outer membrane protein TolC
MKPLIVAALVAAVASDAHAQPPTISLSLEDAVTRAIEASHRLAEINARKSGADASVRVQESASRPSVSAQAAYARINHVDEFGFPQPGGPTRVFYPDAPNNITTRLSFNWAIYTAGRTDALERAARAEASAVASEIAVARADLRFETVRTYWSLATATEAVRVLTESVARSDAQLQDARNRLAAGIAPPNEVSSFEAQRSQEALQLLEAEHLRDSVTVELRRLIGARPDDPIAIASPLTAPDGTAPATAPAATQPVSSLVTLAVGQRPERQSIQFQIAAAEARQRAAAVDNRPTVGFTGGVDYNDPNRKVFPIEERWRSTWDLSVGLTWPVFDGGRTKARTAEAQAAVDAARERLADLETAIDADVRQRLLDLDSARAAVRTADTGVAAAAEARRVLGNRFAAGVASNTDVLVAQDALLQAELVRTRAVANVRLAEARLERALGTP